MSISPTDDKRSESETYREISQNPTPDHGFSRASALEERTGRRRIGTPSPEDSRGKKAADPVETSDTDLDEVARSSVESTVAICGEPCDSSKNVTAHRNARKASCVRDSETSSESQSSLRGGMSSEFRSDRIGPKVNGKTIRKAGFLHSDHPVTSTSDLLGNVGQSTSRRNQLVNANHLLNFQYDPISRPPPRGPPPRRQRKIKPYNKDLFLQANYKFVVLDTGNYLIELMDPDKMLQWEDIVCVRYSSWLPVQCPICLESPLCPQMTSCGHIYCFPCILRYLLMGEEDHKGDCWKKCPLCFLMISSKDMLTVQIENVKQFNVGDCADFVLLSRAKDSLVPSLKNQQGQDPAPCSNGRYDPFAKFTLTSDVELSIRGPKADLSNWLHKAESGLVDDLEMLPYVCAALEKLQERMKNWMEHPAFGGIPLNTSLSSHKIRCTPSKTDSNVLNSTTRANSANSSVLEPEDKILCSSFKYGLSEVPEKLALPESFGSPVKVLLSYDQGRDSQASCKDANGMESYAFYQATDGQHLILHPLNMKCLLHHYGSYDLLPPRVSGEILEMEIVTQSEAMRRRYRSLGHFSLTTTIQLCEIDLSGTLPPSSLTPFGDELKKREKQRKQLAKKEHDEKTRAEAAALNLRAMPYEYFHSSHMNAAFSLDDFQALGSAAVPSTSPPINNERKRFSDVTRLGFAAAHDSPSLKAEGSANSSGSVEKLGEASDAHGGGSINPAAMLSFASKVMSAPKEGAVQKNTNVVVGKKGKKATKLLLSTAGGRRY